MFSKDFSVSEASRSIGRLSNYFFLSSFADGIASVNAQTGLALAPVHERKTGFKFEPTESEKSQLREMLDPEYELFDKLTAAKS